MRLAKFVTRRVITGIGSLFLFLFILFILIEILIPGDVASLMRLGLTQAEFEQVREGLGLTRPLPIRFMDRLLAFFRGEFSNNSFGVRAATMSSRLCREPHSCSAWGSPLPTWWAPGWDGSPRGGPGV